MRTWLPLPKYDKTADRAQFYERVLERTRALPGVTSAAYASFMPMAMGGGIWPVTISGEPPPRGVKPQVSLRYVTPRYFATMGVPMRQGRDVGDGDAQDRPFVAVVSESFARRHWPGQEAIGKRFTVAFAERTVVGVAGDVRTRGPERESEPQVYVPYRQVPDGWLPFYAPKDLALRTAGGGSDDAVAALARDHPRRRSRAADLERAHARRGGVGADGAAAHAART